MASFVRFYLYVSMLLVSSQLCADQLVIMSPHRKSVQQEIIPLFKEYYKKTFKTDVNVEWLDHDGAQADLRYVLARFEKNPKTAEIDLFWGGGEHPHVELNSRNLLLPHLLSPELKKQIPQTMGGVTMFNSTETWHAAAASSFGIFFNKKLLKVLRVPAPNTWTDLADPRYYGYIANTDPRHSSSFTTMDFIILQSAANWDEGWQALTQIAANTRSFTHSATGPLKSVVSGEAIAGISICYFALAKIGDLGSDNLGFVFPQGKTIMNADPISLLKGAPNAETAKRFIDYVLSKDAQMLLILKKGVPHGPQYSTLGRMAINRAAYDAANPAQVIAKDPLKLNFSPFVLDLERVTKMQFVLADLVGVFHIDHHNDLKAAWQAVIKRGAKPEELKKLGQTPLSEDELWKLTKVWNNQKERNQVLNRWSQLAKERYQHLINLK